MKPTIPFWTLLLMVLVVLLLASCSSPTPADSSPPPPTQSSAATPSPSVQHWVQDKKLRQVMADIGRRVPTLPGSVQTPQTRPVTAEEFDKIANLAAGLSQSCEQIVPVATTIPMTEADRRGFMIEVQLLHDQADQLQTAASERRIDTTRQAMDAINSTCISCHSRYRDFSGQIDLAPIRS